MSIRVTLAVLLAFLALVAVGCGGYGGGGGPETGGGTTGTAGGDGARHDDDVRRERVLAQIAERDARGREAAEAVDAATGRRRRGAQVDVPQRRSPRERT